MRLLAPKYSAYSCVDCYGNNYIEITGGEVPEDASDLFPVSLQGLLEVAGYKATRLPRLLTEQYKILLGLTLSFS